MKKTAETAVPIHDLLAERWSPRSFLARAVEPEKLGAILEAARWAPSCYNDQPWHFVLAHREDPQAFAALSSCLVAGNAWAKEAPLLMLSVARLRFAHNDKPNHHAWHDVGLAAMSMVVQAEALGLSVHQMAGFDAARARAVLAIPDGHDPVAMIAIGYRGEPDALPDKLAERERARRTRRRLEEIAFRGSWGTPL